MVGDRAGEIKTKETTMIKTRKAGGGGRSRVTNKRLIRRSVREMDGPMRSKRN